MNVNRIKALLWLAAFGVGGYLVWFTYDFLQKKPELEKALSVEEQEEVLNNVQRPEEEERDLVAFSRVNGAFTKLDWTGKPPPPPPKPVENRPKGPVEKPKVKAADLVKVLYTEQSLRDPAGSKCMVNYQGELARHNQDTDLRVLRVGDTLPPPRKEIVVDSIAVEGVYFRFTDDEEREPELVAKLELNADEHPKIVKVDEGGQIIYPTTSANSLIPRASDDVVYIPGETQRIGKNEFLLGTKTLDQVNADYSQILSRDLKYKRHRGADGRFDGIQITEVRAGSIPAQHGVSRGEILKSINGHRVTSVNEAIAYVKANKDTTDTWVAVFEKQGREVTRTYRSPPR